MIYLAQTVAFLLLLFSAVSQAQTQANNELRIQLLESEKDRLIHQLLDLSLSKAGVSPTYVQQDSSLSAGRLVERVESNKMDVFWAGMSPDTESRLRPIRIPIFKGLLGHRIFVVHQNSVDKFANIQSLEDLKQFSAGQGRFWGDTEILQRAGLPVTTTVKGQNLWAMLDGGRFDYFPLAVHEPWSEIDARPELNLTVDPNVLLVYPFAMYFYVNQSNSNLYNAIKQGMDAAIDDGSYDQLLFQSAMLKQAFSEANLARRKIIRIPNPNMHPDTPVNTPKYWLDPTAQ